MAEVSYLKSFLAMGDPEKDEEGFSVYGPERKRASQLLADARDRDYEERKKKAEETEGAEDDIEDELLKNNFIWECCEDDPDLQDFLENSLPQGFRYKVTKLKLLEESKIKNESSFMARFKVVICSQEQLTDFLTSLEYKTETSYHPDRKEQPSHERNGRKWTSRRYHCTRKIRERRQEPEEKRRRGSGSQKGEERQKGQSTNCPSYFSYQFYQSENNLEMTLLYDHNHDVTSTDAWNFLKVSKETEERYWQLFEQAYTPSKARLIYLEELKAKLGQEEYFKRSSSRAINPGRGYIFRLNTKFYKRFGSFNGPDSYLLAVEHVRKLNEMAGESIASISQLDCGTVSVAVCDALMK